MYSFFLFIFIILVSFVINRKYLHSRRDSQFKELAKKFNLQVSCVPQIQEGTSVNIGLNIVSVLDIKKENIKFLEERRLFGEIKSKSIIIQDSIGKDGTGTSSFFKPEYGGKTSHRLTTIYVDNEIVSNNNNMTLFPTYMPISDIEKFISSI